MKTTSAIAGGIAGACALTLMHQVLKTIDPEAPRMDLLGMEAISLGLKKSDHEVPSRDTLYGMAMSGDLVSNALYYSLTGLGKKRNAWYRGASLGLAAGLGAVLLPKPMGLHTQFSTRTTRTTVMSIALYLAGGLVSAAVSKAVDKRR